MRSKHKGSFTYGLCALSTLTSECCHIAPPNKSCIKEQPALESLVLMHVCVCGHRQHREAASTRVDGGHACGCAVTGSSCLTSLLGVRLNCQDDTVRSLVSQLQPVQQTCDLRVTVWTDHIEGIARLVGKLSFLEKDQGDTE